MTKDIEVYNVSRNQVAFLYLKIVFRQMHMVKSWKNINSGCLMVADYACLNRCFLFIYTSSSFLQSTHIAFNSKQRKTLDHNIKRLNCLVKGVRDRRRRVD